MRPKFSYHSILFFRLLQRILFLFLIVFITATPVVRIIFNQIDVKYEQCEIYGEDDPKENEMIVDDSEDEYQELSSIQNLSSKYPHKCFMEFNPDIQLPPPKKV